MQGLTTVDIVKILSTCSIYPVITSGGHILGLVATVATVSQQPLRTGRSTVIDPATAPPALTTLPQLGQHLGSTGGGAGGEAAPCPWPW